MIKGNASCDDVRILRHERGVSVKFILFGTGEYYQRYKKWFNKDEIVALIDNSSNKQHNLIDGTEVLPPEEGIHFQYDYIVILSFYVKEMRKQLMELGVHQDRILHFFELYKLKRNRVFEMQFFGRSEEEVWKNRQQSVLLLSTDLELQGGPATVLIGFARVLKKNGYDVVFGSMQDGPQKEKLLADGIPVVIDPNLQVKQMADIEWTHGFRKVICNTIGFNVFISRRDEKTPVVWWLHDSSFFYDGVDIELLKGADFSNVDVYSVGKVPRMAIQEILPGLKVRELLYGLEDEPGVVNFIVLGYIENRKGQDILLEAVRLLDDEIRKKTMFYLVGNDSSEMAARIKEQAADIPQIVFTGMLCKHEKKAFINLADVIVCPSREDPMPVAVAEAIMVEKVPVVSDATGMADYIQDGMNGFVFLSGDYWMLKEKIEFCVQHFDMVKAMGKQSRKIYEEHFSMEAFEKSVLETVQ